MTIPETQRAFLYGISIRFALRESKSDDTLLRSFECGRAALASEHGC